MNSIGTLLKEARSKKDISLDDVHGKIKIHPRVLQLLEDGKFDKLPSPLFAKSFLRSYAEFLELNPEDIIQVYEKEEKQLPDQVLFLKTPEEKKKADSRLHNAMPAIIFIACLIGAIVAGVLVWKKAAPVLARLKERKISAPAPAASTKAAAPVKAAAVEPEESPKKQAPWLRSPEQGNFPKIGKKTQLDLKVKALDNVWLRVTCDEKVLFQSILQKGASETWKAGDSIEIWTGNSSSMELSLNRYSLGSPGKGAAKKMLINREGVKLTQKI